MDDPGDDGKQPIEVSDCQKCPKAPPHVFTHMVAHYVTEKLGKSLEMTVSCT